MKQSITIALSAILALAAAAPLEKRDGYTTTVIEDVTDIVDVYTTVYVSSGDPRLTQNQQPVTQTPSSVPIVSVTPPVSTSAIQTSAPSPATSQAPIVVPQQKQEAHVEAPAPTTTPVPSVTPQAVTPKVEAVAPPPVVSSPAPAPSPAPAASSTSDSGPSGGACGQKNGKCIASDVTTFDGGMGACGFDDATYTQNYFALAHEMMGEASNSNPNCNRTAAIVYNGQTFHGTLQDKCMGCTGASLDLSLPLFKAIFPSAGGTGRFHDIEWYFTS